MNHFRLAMANKFSVARRVLRKIHRPLLTTGSGRASTGGSASSFDIDDWESPPGLEKSEKSLSIIMNTFEYFRSGLGN